MAVYKLKAPRSPVDGRRGAAPAMHQVPQLPWQMSMAELLNDQQLQRKPVTVCFTGHRVISAAAQQGLTMLLDRVLEKLYAQGCRDFISGGALGFDTLAAERVIALRSKHADVHLVLAIPCSDQTRLWTASQCRRYERLMCMADEMQVLSGEYAEGCMHQRNRYMVDRSSLCIAYLAQPTGGTLVTVRYALRSRCPVLNLADNAACRAFITGD